MTLVRIRPFFAMIAESTLAPGMRYKPTLRSRAARTVCFDSTKAASSGSASAGRQPSSVDLSGT